MKNYNLTPYDWDLVGMIDSLTKQKSAVAIDSKNNRFEIYWKLDDDTENLPLVHQAIINAIKGRLGDRYIETMEAPTNITYVKFDSENWETEEIRFDISNAKTKIAPRYKRELNALKFLTESNDYINAFASFVGGGNYIKSNSEAIPSRFEFLNESGLVTIVNENDYVVFQDGKFEVMKQRVFESQFKIFE